MMRISCFLICPIIVAFVAMSANAQTTYYVDDACGDDSWNATSSTCAAPDGPKATIQAAIDLAADGDTIILADGLYDEPGNTQLEFLGKALTLKSANGPLHCTISGDPLGIPSPPQSPLMRFVTGEGRDTVLEELTLRNGCVCGVSGFNAGAITCIGSSPTFRRCVIQSNDADASNYSTLYCSGGSPLFEDCSISGNPNIPRGAVYCDDAQPEFRRCNLSGNGASSGTESPVVVSGPLSHPVFEECTFGGHSLDTALAILHFDNQSQGTITSCNFDDTGSRQIQAETGTIVNMLDTTFNGGEGTLPVVRIVDGDITRCTFTDNYGFGIVSTLLCIGNNVVSDCLIQNNTSEIGSNVSIRGNTEILNSKIVDNVAMFFNGNGCGVRATAGICLIKNTLIADNSVSNFDGTGEGGGVYANPGANVTIENCTIANNSADFQGGGLFGPATVINTIFWGNTPDQYAGGAVTATYCDVEGGAAGTGNINADPLFVDAAMGDYHLSLPSPCRNAGDPNTVTDPNDIDIDDEPRVQGGRVDIGADEFAIADGDFDKDGDVDLSDFAQFSLCFGGANTPPAASCPPGVDADFDDDGDVDLGDFSTFSLNFTGPL